MPSDDPIILEPDKSVKPDRNVMSFIPQGIQSIRTVIKQYTTWLFAAMAAIPDLLFQGAMWLWHALLAAPHELYAAAGAAGMLGDSGMPQSVLWFIRVFSLMGLIANFIKQKKPA